MFLLEHCSLKKVKCIKDKWQYKNILDISSACAELACDLQRQVSVSKATMAYVYVPLTSNICCDWPRLRLIIYSIMSLVYLFFP